MLEGLGKNEIVSGFPKLLALGKLSLVDVVLAISCGEVEELHFVTKLIDNFELSSGSCVGKYHR